MIHEKLKMQIQMVHQKGFFFFFLPFLNKYFKSNFCSPSKELSSKSLKKEPENLIFGIELVELAEREKKLIPSIIVCCIEEVEKRGIEFQGIYRISGSSPIVKQLKAKFQANQIPSFEEVEIPCVTSLLKEYLRDLPTGLIPDDVFNKLSGPVQEGFFLFLFFFFLFFFFFFANKS